MGEPHAPTHGRASNPVKVVYPRATNDAIYMTEHDSDRQHHLFDQLPFHDVTISPERFVVELHNRPDLHNSHGALQGGLVATLIDVAAGRLALANVAPTQAVTTADLNVHYLAAIRIGPAQANATIVRKGRRMIVVAVDVTDVGGDRIAARATVSFIVLDPR